IPGGHGHAEVDPPAAADDPINVGRFQEVADHHLGASGPQGRRPLVLASDHGADREASLQEQADHGPSHRPKLPGCSGNLDRSVIGHVYLLFMEPWFIIAPENRHVRDPCANYPLAAPYRHVLHGNLHGWQLRRSDSIRRVCCRHPSHHLGTAGRHFEPGDGTARPCCRRTRPMLGRIRSLPASAWRRITLPFLTRTFRTPRVLDERVPLLGYDGRVRQIIVIDLGHEEPTILLTNNLRTSCPKLVTRYAQRMLIENGISEAVQFFHLDALSSMIGMKVDFDLQITLMASALYRLLANRIGRQYQQATAKKIFRNLLDVSATVEVLEHEVVVTLDKRTHNPFLVASGLADEPTPSPGLATSVWRSDLTDLTGRFC